MTGIPSEHAHDVREALRIVVSDPGHGAATLSNPQVMSNLLKDLLPDAPREKNLLVAAAEANLARMMLDHVAQGIDARSAIRLAAASFGANTHFTGTACTWVTTELAVALDLGTDLGADRTELPAGDITTVNPVPASPAADAIAAQPLHGTEPQGADDAAHPVATVPDAARPGVARPGPATRTGRPSVASAVIVLAGVLALTGACAIPVYAGSPPGRIWGSGASDSWFIATAPTAALLVALLAGLVLLLGTGTSVRVAAAGAALASGIEVIAIFFAIYWQAIRDYGNPLGAGLALGLISALLLIAGGAVGLRGRAAAALG